MMSPGGHPSVSSYKKGQEEHPALGLKVSQCRTRSIRDTKTFLRSTAFTGKYNTCLVARLGGVRGPHPISLRVGEWLPSDHRTHKKWLEGIINHVDKNPSSLHPVLEEFKQLIETNTRIFCLIASMFDQVPNKKPYTNDPTGRVQIRDYQHLLRVLNHLITTGPTWTDKAERVGMVGVPISAALDWPMGTSGGFAFFLDPEVNAMLKKILNVWGDFLRSEESAKQCLGKDDCGWFSPHGKSDLAAVANNAAHTSHTFEELFHCDPTRPYHGFTSWDDFFTRTFRDGMRPVASPDDDSIIANACESKSYNVAYGCQLRDKFWLKGQKYSILDMLAFDDLAPQFEGGTVYQAFLSALSYHRWHAPVSGRIVKAFVQDGTYYSEPLFEGLGDPSNHGDIDVKGTTTSQGYLTAVATRAIIFIEADNAAIGLMAFIAVGMVEVSTCEITVQSGQHVKKGDQMGMFHFGGSTHCMLFRKDADVHGFPQPGGKENIPVRSKLAEVRNRGVVSGK
jgi:phosphatidylserine decarboxylase